MPDRSFPDGPTSRPVFVASSVRRRSWGWRIVIATASVAVALAATHTFWIFVQHTPFLLGFGAAILSSRLGGASAGFLSVLLGAIGYAWFPPPLAADGFAAVLAGFVVISGTFSWLVGRRYDVESQLRSSEARLKQAQELAHVGNWQWDIATQEVWWSDELYRIFGVDRGSFRLSYPGFLELVHPEDRSTIESAIRQAFKDGMPYKVEHRVVRPDGGVRVVVGHGRVVCDDTGRIVQLAGATQDITERKVAEETVRRSERRLQTIFDAEPACVMLTSASGALLDINRAGLEMIGADNVAQLCGLSVMHLVHPGDRDAVLHVREQVCGGVRCRLEFRVVTLRGEDRWVDAHFVPFEILNASGPQTAVLSVTSDITERKRLEEQLRHSQKMEAIGLLAGGIAHDFNNLLTTVGGYAELVLHTLDDSHPSRGDLLEISRAARHGSALTRQLLAVSRRQILEPSVLDVSAMIVDFENLLRRAIAENIQIHLELGTVDPVRADRGQLEQVVLNLAINAGSAMPQGGELRIRTASVDVDDLIAQRHPPMTPGRYVRLSVIDTGVGIPPDIQHRIFEPFFTAKPGGKGTGLGLAIVYGIVKQSGGFVWVTSAVGRGTTVDIYLPVVDAPVGTPVQERPPFEASGGSQTILLAEDDGAVRRLARAVLTKAGYTVLDACDGDEAFQLAGGYPGPIHLLVTDVVMPGLSGRALASRLVHERTGLRVLYTSGYTQNVMMHAGFEEDVKLLAKPFLPADLLSKVREVLA